MNDVLTADVFVPDPPADVPPSLVSTARAAAALLAAADFTFATWMIATAARQQLGGAVYALCLAVPVLAGVLLAFLAAHPRARVRPMSFARVGLVTLYAQAAFLVALSVHAVVAPDAGALLAVRLPLLLLTLAAAAAFSLIPYRAATHEYLQQIAHRAIALGIFMPLTWVGLMIWDRPLSFTRHLLPAALALFAVASLCALAVVWTSRDHPAANAEAHRLARAAVAFLLVVSGLMLLLVAPPMFRDIAAAFEALARRVRGA